MNTVANAKNPAVQVFVLGAVARIYLITRCTNRGAATAVNGVFRHPVTELTANPRGGID